MRNLLFIVSSMVLLSGCGILPGMQNLDTTDMHVEHTNYVLHVKPTVIPITPLFLLHDDHQVYTYRVGSQDILNVMIWNHHDLNTPLQQIQVNPALSNQSQLASGYLVDDQGDIDLPLVGTVHVSGKTVAEIRHLITQKYSYYIRKPQVFIRVVDFRSKKVYIMGEVMKPGFLALNDQPLSLTEAINIAGSLDPNASDPQHIYVIRGNVTRPLIYWLNISSPTALLLGEQFQLKPNDIIIVSTAVVTRWNRFLNQLLPTLQSVWYTKAITGK